MRQQSSAFQVLTRSCLHGCRCQRHLHGAAPLRDGGSHGHLAALTALNRVTRCEKQRVRLNRYTNRISVVRRGVPCAWKPSGLLLHVLPPCRARSTGTSSELEDDSIKQQNTQTIHRLLHSNHTQPVNGPCLFRASPARDQATQESQSLHLQRRSSHLKSW